MCKVFGISNLSRVKVTTELLTTIREAITESEKHGFGYAIVNRDGDLAGERTLAVNDFKALKATSPTETKVCAIAEPVSNVFGNLKKAVIKPKSLIAHGRTSTNTVNLDNTHPFTNGKLALIHNGVVQDVTDAMKPYLVTDNDTEILFRYYEHEGIKGIEENVAGYYACLVLDVKGNLTLFKDDVANLYMAWSPTIGSWIFGTTKDLIETVCDEMDWKLQPALKVLDNSWAIFNGNRMTSNGKLTPKHGFRVTQEYEDKADIALKRTRRYPKHGWYDAYEDADEEQDVIDVSEFVKANRAAIKRGACDVS